MRLLPLIAYLLLAATALSFAAEPTTPDQFIAAFRKAFEEKSPEKLAALTYTVGMTEADKTMLANSTKNAFSDKEIESISLVPLPPDFETVFILRGKKIEPTATPEGQIQVKYKATGNGINTTNLPYAIIDGQYFLTGIKITDLGWNGPPDKTITFMVMGTGQDKVQIKAKWNASGVDQERTFHTPSSNFMGQYFEEITVTSTEDNTNVTLTLMEDSKKIYTSEPLKGKGTLHYKK